MTQSVTTPIDLPEGLTAIPPTQYELPSDSEDRMETQRHKVQMELLIDALVPWLEEREDGYVGGNMFLYFSMQQLRGEFFLGPDVFVALGVPKGERLSWVVWEEGKSPDVVIELLSRTTAKRDKEDKMAVYQNQMRVPEYFWFDPFNPGDRAGFHLQDGVYHLITPDERGRFPSRQLNLALALWQGSYKGIENITWWRWETPEGELLLTPEELERQRADRAARALIDERERADRAEQQLEQVAIALLTQGTDIAEVVRLTGLPEERVRSLQI